MKRKTFFKALAGLIAAPTLLAKETEIRDTKPLRYVPESGVVRDNCESSGWEYKMKIAEKDLRDEMLKDLFGN